MKPAPDVLSLGPELEALLERRTARVRAAAAERSDEEAALPVATFTAGGERYALPLAVLRAVVPVRNVTPVPLAPPYVVGVLRFQGQLVAAFSLAALLGVRGWHHDPSVLLVLEPSPGRRVALDCEQIPTPGSLPLRLVEESRGAASGPLQTVTLRDPGAGTDSGEKLTQLHLIDAAALLRTAGGETRNGP